MIVALRDKGRRRHVASWIYERESHDHGFYLTKKRDSKSTDRRYFRHVPTAEELAADAAVESPHRVMVRHAKQKELPSTYQSTARTQH